jgi:hypothetical protein
MSPSPVIVSRLPFTDAGPDTTLNVTGSPDEAEAFRVNGDWVELKEAGGLKTRVWATLKSGKRTTRIPPLPTAT